MLEAQGGDVRIMDQIARGLRPQEDARHDLRVALGLVQEDERRRIEDPLEVSERPIQRNRRVIHTGVRYDAQELVDARPWDGPGFGSLCERDEQGERLVVLRARLNYREDEDIGVHRLHDGSAPVHDVKEGPAVEDVHSGLGVGPPALDPKLVVAGATPESEGLPEELVRDFLERPLLADGFLLHPSEQVVVDTKRRPGHTSMCNI